MPELRKDPVLDRWVIISSERIHRPTDYRYRGEMRAAGGFCPFCSGNEYTTPSEIYAVREPGSEANGPGWSLRVVPNKFPALRIEGGLKSSPDDLYPSMNGIGAHEVIIETPDHDRNLTTIPETALIDVLEAYRARIADLEGDDRLRYVLVFKNQGPQAGATLEHSHSQLIALPVLPRLVAEEMTGAAGYFERHGRCVYCDLIASEREQGTRVVFENEAFVVLSPYAAPFPFETWILPRTHHSHYQDSAGDYPALAVALRDILRRLDGVLDDPDYNLVLHTSPLRADRGNHYHWHFEIVPKLTQVAGFEWGSGFFINPAPPEDAAAFLREYKGG